MENSEDYSNRISKDKEFEQIIGTDSDYILKGLHNKKHKRKGISESQSRFNKLLYNNTVICKSKQSRKIFKQYREECYKRFKELVESCKKCCGIEDIYQRDFFVIRESTYLKMLHGDKNINKHVKKITHELVECFQYYVDSPYLFTDDNFGKSFFYIEIHYEEYIKGILVNCDKFKYDFFPHNIIIDSNEFLKFKNEVVNSQRISKCISSPDEKHLRHFHHRKVIIKDYSNELIKSMLDNYLQQDRNLTFSFKKFEFLLDTATECNLLTLFGVLLCEKFNIAKVTSFLVMEVNNIYEYRLGLLMIKLISETTFNEVQNLSNINQLIKQKCIVCNPDKKLIDEVNQYNSKCYCISNGLQGVLIKVKNQSLNCDITYSNNKYINALIVVSQQIMRIECDNEQISHILILLNKQSLLCLNYNMYNSIAFNSICQFACSLFDLTFDEYVSFIQKIYKGIFKTEADMSFIKYKLNSGHQITLHNVERKEVEVIEKNNDINIMDTPEIYTSLSCKIVNLFKSSQGECKDKVKNVAIDSNVGIKYNKKGNHYQLYLTVNEGEFDHTLKGVLTKLFGQDISAEKYKELYNLIYNKNKKINSKYVSYKNDRLTKYNIEGSTKAYIIAFKAESKDT